MTKFAHITSRPNHEVGDRVLGLCGKDFKVKVLWADLPREKPICRDCVDTAVSALTEADEVIGNVRSRAALMVLQSKRIADALDPEDGLMLDLIAMADQEHRTEQEEKRVQKALEERLAQTCTCTWTTPEVFTEDPLCPIHGKTEDLILDAIGVEVPEEEK